MEIPTLKSEDQEIDGLTFRVVQFPAMYGFALLARLAKCIGPALGALGSIAPDDMAAMAPALRDALATLDPDEAQKLALEILKCTSVLLPKGGGEVVRVELTDKTKIDQVFSGRLKTMFKALGFAVRVNFSDFVSGSVPGTDTPKTLNA